MTKRYYIAYLLGIPTLFLYTLIWMAKISEQLKEKAIELGIEGPHSSFWHMFGWNVFGVFFFGPMIATHRFFNTLNKIEKKLNGEKEQMPRRGDQRNDKHRLVIIMALVSAVFAGLGIYVLKRRKTGCLGPEAGYKKIG